MMKRILASFCSGSFSAAIVGAAGFALAEAVFGRGIGMLGNSPARAALLGAILVGTCGGIAGAVVGMIGLTVRRSGAVGFVCGMLLLLGDLMRSERTYFFDGGYSDWHLLFSDFIQGTTLALGLSAAAMAAAFLQRTGSRTRTGRPFQA